MENNKQNLVSSSKNKIYLDDYFGDKGLLLRRINTNIFTYIGFFVFGFVFIIVAAILTNQGVVYLGKNDGYIHEDSSVVIEGARRSLFIVGGLFIGFIIIVNLYVIFKINQSNWLKYKLNPVILYLLYAGIILQITTFIGMIMLYIEVKKFYLLPQDLNQSQKVNSSDALNVKNNDGNGIK